MRSIDTIGQKIKGRIQQVKGEIEDRSGQHVKGKLDKIRGKVNEAAADIKSKI